MQTTTTPNNLTASEPVTHEALLEMGFTGSIADYYMIHLDDEGFLSLIIGVMGGRYDSLCMTAPGLSNNGHDLTGIASDMAGVRAFYKQAKAVADQLEAESATRIDAMMPKGFVAPFAGE